SAATLKEVSYVEPIYEMSTQNANMQWVLQTNINGNRKIWDQGLNGSGQIITYADTGLDYDHRMFRESAGTIVTGDIYNVTDPSRRKLIRYQPMAQWYVDNGIDRDGDGIPETEEDPNGDGILEAYSDSWVSIATSGHGTMVSGTGAGRDDDSGGTSGHDGGAKGAKIYLQDIGSVYQNPQVGGAWDDQLTWIPDDYYWLFIDSYLNGSRIHSNSWGAQNSDYDLEAMMVDEFMWDHQDFLILFSNGNGGLGAYDVGSPATAKSAVSVGSSGNSPNQNSVAGYSSPGPSTDGRRKPTIAAVGTGTSSVSSGDPLDGFFTGQMGTWGGTSYAAPAASSLAAMVRQYFEKGYYPNGLPLVGNEFYPSAALIKAMIMASGQMMTGSFADRKSEWKYPNNSQGWGRPLLDDVLYFSGDTRKTLVVNNSEGITTGKVIEYEFNVSSDAAPLEVFLAWNDYPGAVGSSPATVNNLNLQLEAPNGTTFWGNKFDATSQWAYRGYSTPSGVPDSLNTDEGIIITRGTGSVDNWLLGATAASGDGIWKVRVIAENIPSGPQPFGLVVIGDLSLSYGLVTIDKKVYSETDTIKIEVIDTNLVSPDNYTIVKSTTESGGEQVNLIEVAAGSGIWKGSIDIEMGLPSGGDNKLQVKDGDTITVTYD
ncbi:MAG: S8 family serine peptidase, partial [Thermoplasmata archaeon]|nr:S8 family serine peptidase [Thermoplasmata archaeon]